MLLGAAQGTRIENQRPLLTIDSHRQAVLSSRPLRHVCFPDRHQHDAHLVVGVASPIDSLQSKQGSAYQEAGIGAGIGQGNDDAAIVLPVLAAEAIRVDERLLTRQWLTTG